MTGIAATMSGAVTSGGGVTPTPVVWFDIFGTGIAVNNSVTFAGLSAPITLQVTGTGDKLYFQKNSDSLVKIPEAGTVTVSNGDNLAWGAGKGFGTVTVTNLSDGSTVLAAFNFDVGNGLDFD